MPHYPGHRDDNVTYGSNPVVPAQRYVVPPRSASSVWSATQPRNAATAAMFERLRNPQKNASGRTVYPAIPAGPLMAGASWEQVPGGYVYVPPSATTSSATTSSATGGGMGRVNTNFNKITNADQQQRQSLRTQYMMGLSPLQEGIRQARVAGTQSSDLLRSQLAQTAIGGFGGISGAAEQRVLDAARGQEGGFIRDKADLRSDYLAGLLGVDKQTADAISAEAVKRAAKLAAAEKDYLMKEAQRLVAQYEKLGEQ